jgi:hypothetical protein
MFARTSHKQALAFATQNFAPCDVHQADAIAVHQALQRLCEKGLPDIEPAKLVRQILPAPASVPASVFDRHTKMDSRDQIELALAIEEEQGSIGDSEMDGLLNDLLRTKQVFDALLGSVASASTWDPATIWFRSIGNVVNERVRHRGGCGC